MPPRIQDSPSEKQNSPQIVKHFRAESTTNGISEDVFFEQSKDKENKATVSSIDVLLNTMKVQNDSLPVETAPDDTFIISELDNVHPPGAALYKSGWEYSQLVKEFRMDW